jgi:hypothetical protein
LAPPHVQAWNILVPSSPAALMRVITSLVSGCYQRDLRLPAFCTQLPDHRHFAIKSDILIFLRRKPRFLFASTD